MKKYLIFFVITFLLSWIPFPTYVSAAQTPPVMTSGLSRCDNTVGNTMFWTSNYIKWSDTSGASQYKVYIQTGTSTYTLLEEVNNTAHDFYHQIRTHNVPSTIIPGAFPVGMSPNGPYWYRVTSVIGGVESEMSDHYVRIEEPSIDVPDCTDGTLGLATVPSTFNYSLLNGGDKTVVAGSSVTNTVTTTFSSGPLNLQPLINFIISHTGPSGFSVSPTSFSVNSILNTIPKSVLQNLTISTTQATTPGTYTVTVNAVPQGGGGPSGGFCTSIQSDDIDPDYQAYTYYITCGVVDYCSSPNNRNVTLQCAPQQFLSYASNTCGGSSSYTITQPYSAVLGGGTFTCNASQLPPPQSTSFNIVVTATPAAYTVTASPTILNPGQTVTAAWTAPSGHSTTDWIGIYTTTAVDSMNSYPPRKFVMSSSPTGSLDFIAPATPGTYQFRYFLKNSYDRRAISNDFTVNPYGLKADGSVECSPKITLNWNAIAGATSYTITRITGSDLATYTSLTNSYIDYAPPAAIDTLYVYQVKANNLTTSSAQKTASMSRPLSCYNPQNLSASEDCGSGKITLRWTAPTTITGLQGYNIYRDGTKINMAGLISGLEYNDESPDVTLSVHTYIVKSVYQTTGEGSSGTATSDVCSIPSGTVTLKIGQVGGTLSLTPPPLPIKKGQSFALGWTWTNSLPSGYTCNLLASDSSGWSGGTNLSTALKSSGQTSPSAPVSSTGKAVGTYTFYISCTRHGGFPEISSNSVTLQIKNSSVREI